MKMKIEKDFTTLAQADGVRRDMREFKSRYTDGDLLHAFQDATGLYESSGHDILSVDIEAFPAGNDFGDSTVFCAVIVTKGFEEFYEIRCYFDMDLTVDTSEAYWFGDPAKNPHHLMYSQKYYTINRKIDHVEE